MHVLILIIAGTFSLSLLAWVGLATFLLKEETQQKILLPLVAFSAGSLIGGAMLHLLPETFKRTGPHLGMFVWLLIGFSVFFLMEQFLAWHHHHAVPSEHRREPFSYLILIADALHNFIGGLAVAGAFLASTQVGLVTWIAAAAHEIPQELGDFGILLRGGWKKSTALWLNFLSALTVIPGGIVAYFVSTALETTFLLPFAAGNFLYIGASDLIPEVKGSGSLRHNLFLFLSFVGGLAVILGTKLALESE